MTEAFPLQWPKTWKRTQYRERARFKATFGKARDELLNELRLLGAKNVIISSNMPLRADGLPYSKGARPGIDSGVAVYFELFNNKQCIPCDKWQDIEDNLHAINLCVGALRGLERWGAKEMVQATFTGFQALPDYTSSGTQYFEGCNNQESIRARYLELAKKLHPDTGGTNEEFARMQSQYQRLTREQ